MRVIWNELRKILTLKIMLLLVLVSAIFYQLFIVFDFDHFPNGRPSADTFKVGEEMMAKYGQYMDDKEFEDFKKVYEQRVEDATAYLQSQPEMEAAGMGSYEDFGNADLMEDEKKSELHSKVMFEDEVDVMWELQSREELIDLYEHPEWFGYSEGRKLTSEQSDRVEALRTSGNAFAIFIHDVFENYQNLSGNLANLVLVSVMIVVTPLYMADRRNKMTMLQYSTKVGRRLFYIKFAAAFIAVVTVITVQLAVFFYLYRGNDTGQFLDKKVSSVFSFFVSWWDLTFLHYILLTVMSMYIIGIAVLFLVAFISSSAPNYMTNIGLQIPLAAIFISIGIDYWIKDLTSFHLSKLFLPLSLGMLLAVSAGIFLLKWRKERIADVQ
ncbi:hypothetical protein LC048_19395 [Mesobacillus subterraneus]|uniref:hypothetical protein n=1 Tax=Mesobacillus subterraneus TaxID=285983 RepID=UPI001CFE2D61|nr:hypothetical protein [Mesobacillus subterraneus]WLR54567.1 hypothetical protein LC048_19395 [Mesobacillus subterraneus]